MTKIREIGLVTRGRRVPPDNIKPDRSFTSAIGLRIIPITKGPSGTRALSNPYPTRPNINMTQTSKIRLLSAKVPTTQKERITGIRYSFGMSTSLAIPKLAPSIMKNIRTFATSAAADDSRDGVPGSRWISTKVRSNTTWDGSPEGSVVTGNLSVLTCVSSSDCCPRWQCRLGSANGRTSRQRHLADFRRFGENREKPDQTDEIPAKNCRSL